MLGAAAQVTAKPRDCRSNSNFSSACDFGQWVGSIFHPRRETAVKPARCRRADTWLCRSGASQPSARHGTRQHAAGAPPALPCTSPWHSAAEQSLAQQQSTADPPAEGNPGQGLVAMQNCTGMLLLVPASGALMRESILEHGWEFQGFTLVLHEPPFRYPVMPQVPLSLPKASWNVLSPQEGASRYLVETQLCLVVLGCGGSRTLGCWGHSRGPCELAVGLLTDSSIISMQLRYARGSCNQCLHVYSGKINHNC